MNKNKPNQKAGLIFLNPGAHFQVKRSSSGLYIRLGRLALALNENFIKAVLAQEPKKKAG